jgi:hypothetical protein
LEVGLSLVQECFYPCVYINTSTSSGIHIHTARNASSERSVMLISRLFLLNFLLLWQPGTGTNSTTIDDRIKEVENKKLLPDDEGTNLSRSDSFKDISIYV